MTGRYLAAVAGFCAVMCVVSYWLRLDLVCIAWAVAAMLVGLYSLEAR